MRISLATGTLAAHALALGLAAGCGAESAPAPELPEAETEGIDEGDAAEAETADDELAREEETDEQAEADAEDEDRDDRLAELRRELEEKAESEAERWDDSVRERARELAETEFETFAEGVETALAGEHRFPDHPERDAERRPAETLSFFGLEPDMTVLEYGPGAGWYTEILAPVLEPEGALWVTVPEVTEGDDDPYAAFFVDRLEVALDRSPELFGGVKEILYDRDAPALDLSEAVDAALMIRGMHNLARNEKLDIWLEAIYEALEPGGVFGVVQHRADPDADPEESAPDGYLPEPWVVEEVEEAGFELEESSDLNENPDDTRDHPAGVWTLPPSLALGDEDRERYEAIGESDRMTLRFVKPE